MNANATIPNFTLPRDVTRYHRRIRFLIESDITVNNNNNNNNNNNVIINGKYGGRYAIIINHDTGVILPAETGPHEAGKYEIKYRVSVRNTSGKWIKSRRSRNITFDVPPRCTLISCMLDVTRINKNYKSHTVLLNDSHNFGRRFNTLYIFPSSNNVAMRGLINNDKRARFIVSSLKPIEIHHNRNHKISISCHVKNSVGALALYEINIHYCANMRLIEFYIICKKGYSIPNVPLNLFSYTFDCSIGNGSRSAPTVRAINTANILFEEYI